MYTIWWKHCKHQTVECFSPTGGMSEDALIRLTNLQALCTARNWGPTELGRAIKRDGRQMSDMLRGQKSFGEKIARHIEQELKLPRNWLDQDHGKDEAPPPSFHDEKGEAIEHSPVADSPHQATVSHASEPLARGGLDEWGTGNLSPGHVTNATLAPVIEWARVGVDLYTDNDELIREIERPFTTQKMVSRNVKCFRVPDNSLFPDLREGDWAIVDPENLSPDRDRIALFRTPDGAHLLRRFTPTLSEDDFEAYDGAGRVMSRQRHGIVIVATLVTMQRDDV